MKSKLTADSSKRSPTRPNATADYGVNPKHPSQISERTSELAVD